MFFFLYLRTEWISFGRAIPDDVCFVVGVQLLVQLFDKSQVHVERKRKEIIQFDRYVGSSDVSADFGFFMGRYEFFDDTVDLGGWHKLWRKCRLPNKLFGFVAKLCRLFNRNWNIFRQCHVYTWTVVCGICCNRSGKNLCRSYIFINIIHCRK